MEGFTPDVLAYMKTHPKEVWIAMGGAVTVCQKGRINLMADDGMDKAHAHIFTEGCRVCQKLFLELLREQQ